MNAFRWMVRLPVLLLILGMGLPTLQAQEGRRGRRVPGDEDLRETIKVLMIVRMKQELRLSREQELEVIPRVQELFEIRQEFAQQQRKAMRRLRRHLMEDAVPAAKVRESVLRLDRVEEKQQSSEQTLRAEIDRLLRPRQQARFRLFIPEFRRQMQKRIDQAWRLRENRRPALPQLPVLAGEHVEF